MQRSETRAQTPIPEPWTRPHGPLHPVPALWGEEPATDENIERKWLLALDVHALPAINFDLNELEHSAAGTFALWISISSFHRNVVGLLSATSSRWQLEKADAQRRSNRRTVGGRMPAVGTSALTAMLEGIWPLRV